MKQEMLINVAQPEECRIAIVEDGVLEELYMERTQPAQLRWQHLQGANRQPGAEHPGGVRRFRRRPQRLPAHQRRRAAILPPGRLRPANRSSPTEASLGIEISNERKNADETRPSRPRRGRWSQRRSERRRREDGPLSRSACGRDSSRPSRRSSSAATRCSCRSSRKASAPKARRSPRTSASPAATSC